MTTADAVKLATSIPVTTSSGAGSNVEARMRSIGLTITGGKAYSYDTKSELEQPGDKVGDLHFTIQGTQPTAEFKRATCDMWGDADFMKRGGEVLPREPYGKLADDRSVLHALRKTTLIIPEKIWHLDAAHAQWRSSGLPTTKLTNRG